MKIHTSSLYEYPGRFGIKTELQKEKGCYLLYNKDKELIYIGSSKDLHKRLKAHSGSAFRNEIAYYKIAKSNEHPYYKLEKILINHYKPKYNKTSITTIEEIEDLFYSYI